jgi:hypothetical protein
MLRFVFLVLKPNFYLLNCLIMLFKTKVAYNVQGFVLVGDFEFRLPITKVDDCNIADVLFLCQIYNVLLELKLNLNTNVEAFSVSPTCTKPLVSCSLSFSKF